MSQKKNEVAAAQKEATKEVSVATTEEGGALEIPTSLEDLFQEDAGSGLKNLGANDYAIPFITVLQKGSPQASRANSKYVKGAEAGMIMNTLTSKLFSGSLDDEGKGGIIFIPCGYQKQCVRWKSRDSGGGLVCHYDEKDPILKTFKLNERGQKFDPESKDIVVDTAYHFGLLLDPETAFPDFSVISMASTQLKKSRVWNTVMRRIMKKDPRTGTIYNPPSFSHAYRLTTVGEQKDTYDWFGWNIISEGEITDINIYKMAREFAHQVESGNVRVSAPPQEFDDAASSEGDDDGVPF